MEKCCDICGKYFETSNRNRKLCEDCSKDQNARRNMNWAIERSKRTYQEPKTEKFTCFICGKEFVTIRKLLLTKDHHVFCREGCLNEYKKETASCIECGKLIKGSEGEAGYDSGNWHTWFCCKACKEEHDRKIKLENGWRDRKCAYCGKTFFKKEGTFCCKECYNSAVKEGWRPDVPTKMVYTGLEKCRVCGKVTKRTYYGKQPDGLNTCICSDECAKKEREKFSLERKKQRELEKEQKKLESIQENGLCIYCKTPYPDCERMQSNFRIIPKGARYNGNGVLVECPKYKE